MNQNNEDRTRPINTGDQSETSPILGQVLDQRYQVEATLGAGGMGAVYKARHLKMGKEVAVKVLHPQFCLDNKIVNRFTKEIEVMSSLSHPNIITIQDVGTTPFNTPYFVMEYLNCLSLQDVIDGEGPLSIDDALIVLNQIADALYHAHSKGIVHRDLKPANVLLVPSEDRLFVKLVDLGIAKAINPEGNSAEVQLTQTGEVFGSPQYMSPEQCSGEPQDERTDVYAIGCLVYSMLTGEPPFQRKSAMLTIMAHLNDVPPPLRDAHLFKDFTPRHEMIEAFALKCLEKDPNKRFQSMGEVLSELRLIAAGEKKIESVAQEPSKPSRAVRKRPDDVPVDSKSATPDPNKTRNILIAVVAVLIFMSGVTATMMFTNAFQQHGSSETVSVNLGGSEMKEVQEALKQAEVLKNMTPEDWTLKAFSKMDNPVRTIQFDKREGDVDTLKVYSVYSGKPTGEIFKDNVVPGEIDVRVELNDPNLVLCLVSFMPTTWHIKRGGEYVKIKEILAVGQFPQKVEGLPEGCKLTRVWNPFLTEDGERADERTHTNAFEPFYFAFYDNDFLSLPDFKKMKETLFKYTGSHIRSFQATKATDRIVVK